MHKNSQSHSQSYFPAYQKEVLSSTDFQLSALIAVKLLYIDRNSALGNAYGFQFVPANSSPEVAPGVSHRGRHGVQKTS